MTMGLNFLEIEHEISAICFDVIDKGTTEEKERLKRILEHQISLIK